MKVIMINALRERIRRKELYVVMVIGIFMILFCGSNSTSITINGEPLTGFRNMFMVMHVLIHVVGCILAVILSINTIPREYERHNSHLVWVRGISQTAYHGGLAAANLAASAIAVGILYLVLAGYAAVKGYAIYIPKMIPAYLIVVVSVSLVSLWASVLSICLPPFLTGVLAAGFAMVGILYGFLELFRSMVGGGSGLCISILLRVIPDLNGLQKQAYHLIMGEHMDAHLLWTALLALWVISVGLIVLRKKEA